MNLDDFLSAKPLFYDAIDVDRFPQAYAQISEYLPKPDIIHVVGTNGKGSTGRFLATALHRAGKRVGHYTSPHIARFNERIWISGHDVADETLEAAHEKLYALLGAENAESLSYFEYTTLLAMVAYEGCDYVVLEAGLGGEYDATNAFDKLLSVFTPIDFDHAAFLGTTIGSVAGTKLRSMQRLALLGKQQHPEVGDIAHAVAEEKGCVLYGIDERMTPHIRDIASCLAIKNALSDYLRDNLELSICAFEMLGFKAEEALFDQDALFGRLSRIAPNVTLDVGHNPLAARQIAGAFEGKKVTLVYNTYRDKDYREILSILSNVIETVEIIDVDDARIAERGDLEAALKELDIPYAPFEAIQKEKEYLIFGSFSVAEEYLKRMKR